MNRSVFHYLIIVLLTISFSSCSDSSENIPDVSDIEIEVKIRRLEQEYFPLKNRDSLALWLSQNPDIAKDVFAIDKFPDPRMLIQGIYAFDTVVYNDTIMADIDLVFGDLSTLEQELTSAFKFMKYYYPDFKIPKVYTIASAFGHYGFGKDIILGTDYIVISLDYFLGEQGHYKPSMYDYMLERYKPNYIVPTLLSLMSARYIAHDPKDQTMLADILYYGKALHFVNKMVPYVNDSVILGYTGQEMYDLDRNAPVIWGHFIDKDLFYNTDHFTKMKYVDERPKTSEISDICPGRAGRWLGWKILEFYMLNHPDIPFTDVLMEKDAKKLFMKSKYKPKRKE